MGVSRWQTALRRLRGDEQTGSGSGPEIEARLEEFEAVVAAVAPPIDQTMAEPWEPVGLRRTAGAGPVTKPRTALEARLFDQEYEMGERLTCSAEGIAELVLEAIVDDARIRMVAELAEIRVVTSSDGSEQAQLLVEGERVRLAGGTAERVEVPAGVSIWVDEAMGDVRVKGLDAALRIRTVEGDLRLEELAGRVEVERLHSDALVENVAALRIVTCAGDLRFSGGELEAETVAGDARVERATSVKSAKVHGDFWAGQVAGDLEVGLVHGDARVSDVGGLVKLGMVAGDLRASALRGGLAAAHVHGDAQLEGPFSSPEGYSVTANGDVDIRLAGEDDVRLSLRALGRIRSNLSLAPNADGTPSYTATLGEGKTPVTVTCNGDLRVDAPGRGESRRDWERRWGPSGDPFSELSGLGDRIRQQVSASLAAAGINPETGEVQVNFGPGKARGGRGRPPEPPRPPTPPQPPQPPRATMSKEQLTVLKMLEEGRISPEEADALLRALGA